MQTKHQLAAAVSALQGEISAVRLMPCNAIQLNQNWYNAQQSQLAALTAVSWNRTISRLLPARCDLIDGKTGVSSTAQTSSQNLPGYLLTTLVNRSKLVTVADWAHKYCAVHFDKGD